VDTRLARSMPIRVGGKRQPVKGVRYVARIERGIKKQGNKRNTRASIKEGDGVVSVLKKGGMSPLVSGGLKCFFQGKAARLNNFAGKKNSRALSAP